MALVPPLRGGQGGTCIRRDFEMRVDGILFDKDGTLFDFGSTWNTWAARVIPECISAIEFVGHRRATEAYLRQNGFHVVDKNGALYVTENEHHVVSIAFDDQGRLAELKGQFGGDGS